MALYRKFNSNKNKFSLDINIECNGKKRFRVFATDSNKPNSLYADRIIDVNGSRKIYFSFPVSPEMVVIGVENVVNKDDTNFNFTIEEKPLKTYDIWMDKETRDFANLAIKFSQVCGYDIPSANKPDLYSTDDGYFNIKYYRVIKDPNGKPLSTPARIGHHTGNIDVSAVKFTKYTIPMRVAILVHEMSHKYKNPKMNLEISNEIGADINALYIYLGLGFSKIDAICVFANVFLKAQTDENIVRMRKIQEYIDKFEREEFARLN